MRAVLAGLAILFHSMSAGAQHAAARTERASYSRPLMGRCKPASASIAST